MSDKGKKASHDVAKLQRGATQDQARPQQDATAQPKAHEAPKPADMPALGSGGDPLGGGAAAAAKAGELDPKVLAAQQAELARVKALPPGAPELEKYKKPEALAANIPEGSGDTSAAKAQSEGMSPKAGQQGEASLGPSTEQVSSEPAGLKVEVEQVTVPSSPPTTGASAQAVGNAQSPPAEAAAPQEVAAEKAEAPSGGDVALQQPDTQKPDAPAEAQPEAAVAVNAQAADQTVAPAPVATPEQPQQGDATAEAKAATETPPATAGEAPQAVASAVASAPEGKLDQAPEPALQPAAQVADLQPSGAAPREATAAPIAIDTAAPAPVAAASVPQELAGGVTAAPVAAQTQVSGAAAEVSAAAVPLATGGGAVPQAADAAPQQVAEAAMAAGETAPTAQAGGAGAAPAALDAGAAVAAVAGPEPKAEPAAVAEVAADPGAPVAAADVASTEAPAAIQSAGPEAAAAPQGGVDAAVTLQPGTAAGAQLDAAPRQSDGSPSAEQALAPPEALSVAATQEVQPADANARGNLADELAGQVAAQELSVPVFGQTAVDAAKQAEEAPDAMDPAAVETIGAVAGHAGLDPTSLVPQEAVELQQRVDSLFEHGRQAQQQAARLPATVDEALASTQTAAQSGAQDAGRRAKDGVRGAAEALEAGAGGVVQDVLGEGEALGGALRSKAEKALGTDLSQVRVHQGAEASELADAMGATAFAAGEDVVIGSAGDLGGGQDQLVLAEELVHVAQMRGQDGATRGAAGASVASDRAEQSARKAASKVLQGAEIVAEEIEGERRAVYRNDNGATAKGPEMPKQVQLTVAGKTTTVNLPTMTPGTTRKSVRLPAMNVRGLTLEADATLQFDATTGQFTGGKAWASIDVGGVITLSDTQVSIDRNGAMASSFAGATFKVGSLINDTITARVGADGVTGSGSYVYSKLRSPKLDTWLRSGSVQLSVDALGTVSGGGTLGLDVGTFSPGTVQAQVADSTLGGKVSIANTLAISLGKASVSQGSLTGTLTAAEKVDLAGSLQLDIPSLSGGKGTVKATWDSDGGQIAGDAAYDSGVQSAWSKVVFTRATVTGSVADTKLSKMSGNGTATYDALFKGEWRGSIDLDTEKADFELGGGLVAPVIQNEVQVSKGALTLRVEQSELKSTAGNVDFKLGSFLQGTAVLEEGTTANNINATATAELVSEQSFDGVTLSKGAITVKVAGTQVEVVSGSVDLDYKQVAKGTLQLSKSSDIRRFTGSGQANLQPPLQWGDIAVTKGAIDLSLKDNVVDEAQGQMEMAYLDFVKGQMSFDAKEDFTAITGSATATVTAPHDLVAPLHLVPDPSKQFDLAFVNSTFDSFKGAFAWEYEKFKGDVQVNAPLKDFGLIGGTGQADLIEPMPIGTAGSTKLIGQPSSSLTGKIEGGRFIGVSGTLKWQYDAFLEGDAQIAAPRTSIEEIDGVLQATVIAPKNLPNNDKVQVQPGAAGALTIELRNSIAKRYSGTLDYKYDGFLAGQVNVAGGMLDFSQLAGKSAGTVYAKKPFKNVDVLEGSTMNVEFADSQFTTFDGSILFEHGGWLKGTAEAQAGGGSSMSVGVVGKLQGTLLQAPPGGQASGFQYKEGGSVKSSLDPGAKVTTFDAGSEVNWQYDTWLGGALTLDKQSTVLVADGKTDNATLLAPKTIDSQGKMTLLPSSGFGVELANGQPVKYSGTIQARYEQWIEGGFAVAPSSGAQNFDGELTGALVQPMPLGDSGTVLQPGGSAVIKVVSNNVTGISGTLQFQHGRGEKWLGGTVASAKSSGAGIQNLSGDVTGSVLKQQKLQNLTLKSGGAISTQMVSSQIPKLGGTVNYSFGQGSAWIGGSLELTEASTPTLLSGKHSSNITKEFTASAQLKLTASQGLTGQVEQNDLKTIGGAVNWKFSDWLAGQVQAEEAPPPQISGSGDARIVKRHDIIPGKLALVPGGGFQAKITQGTLTSFSGQVPFQYETWAKGTVDTQEANETSITGAAAFAVVSPGKTFDNGGLPVQFKAGGSLTADMTASGLERLGGQANIEMGKAGNGNSWHIKGSIGLQDASVATVRGDVTGAFGSPIKLGASLKILAGGSVRFHLDGNAITQPAGTVNYALTKGPGGPEFIKGSLTLDASSTTNSVSGALQGSVVGSANFGAIKILPGGQLDGTLTANDRATLGGNLAFQYENFLKGTIKVSGQVDPAEGKVSGEAEATTLDGQRLGPLTIGRGSQAGVSIVDSAPKNIWGRLNISTDDVKGTLEVPQGNSSTPTEVSGDATVLLARDKVVGGGLSIKRGSSLQVSVEKNQLTQVKGAIGWKWKDWLDGTLTAETGSTLQQISGSGNAQLVKRYPVGSSTFAITAGTGIGAKVASNALDSVSGRVNWEYGEGGWLAGDLTLPEGSKLDSPSGSATARLARDKVLGQLVLKQGGSLTAEISAGAPTTFGGQVAWGYTAADSWLEGDVTLGSGSTLESISGQATARLARDKELGSELVALKGGSLTATMAGSVPQGVTGDVNWRYQTWLEGAIHVEASSLETVQGTADAHIVTPKMVAPGFELQPGGQAKVTVGGSALKTFSGEVNWKYGEGAPFAQGSVKVAGESAWDSISGQADAQLIEDVAVDADLTLLKAGSNLQVSIAASKVDTFGGHIAFEYGGDKWLKGAVDVSKGSTPKQVSGSGEAAIVQDKPIDGTELTLSPGSQLQVQVESNRVKSFAGTVNWAYGADQWLKGSLVVDQGSTPEHVSGAATATLARYKRVSDEIKLMEGGTLTARFDGTDLKQFSGEVTVGYEDWLLGTLRIDNSTLDDLSGSLKGALRKHMPLSADLMLKQGGSVELKLQNSKMLSFAGDVDWSWQDWLEGNLHVDASTGKDVTGVGQATLVQQKVVGESGKLELQRGSSLQARLTNSQVDGVGGEVAWRWDGWLAGTVGVPAFQKLDQPSGTITASLHTDKLVGDALTLQRGGSVGGELAAGKLTKIQGQVEWKYDSWLGGSATLDPSDPETPTGKASASVLVAKAVQPPLTIERGGSIELALDARKPMDQQPFSAKLGWTYDNWLGGDVQADAGSTFASLNGRGDVTLREEKSFGELTLRRGGQARAQLVASRPDSFGGDLNWQYQNWLAGTLTVADGSKLEALSGQATAAILEDKPLGDGFTLAAGGHAEVKIAANAVDSLGGVVYYKWKDLVDGSLDVAAGSQLKSLSGKATAHLSKDLPVGSGDLVIKQGTSATGTVTANRLDGLSGTLGWRYRQWAEGNVEVQASQLDHISGKAQARVVQPEPLGGDLKLMPGGSLDVTVQDNALTSFGGSVNIQYKDLAKGQLALAGTSADLKSVSGEATARLIQDYPLPGDQVKLLNGSGIGVRVDNGSFSKFSGTVRFQYKDFLAGTLALTDSTPESINGSASAQVIKDFAPGGGQFFLTQGGNLQTDFKASTFDTLEGEVTWRYDNPSAKMDGRITVPRSPVKSIAGEGTARLLQDTTEVQQTKLLAGGNLRVQVEANAPKSISGRADWQHSTWLGGYVELLEGTQIGGPFRGEAGATLREPKRLSDKFEAQAGGNVQLTLDTAVPVDQAQISGTVAVDYEQWLRGSLTVEAGSSFKTLAGTAQVELIGNKELGGSGVTLLQGGNVQAKFSSQGLDSFGGVVMADYQQWLNGSINVHTNSTPEAIGGRMTAQVTQPKAFGDITLLAGGQAQAEVAASKLGTFGGVVNIQYQDWLSGTLHVDGGASFESVSGQATASVIAPKEAGNGITLQPGGHARLAVAGSKVDTFSGEVNVDIGGWAEGAVTLNGSSNLDAINGNAHLNLTANKELPGQVVLKQGSGFQGQMVASKVTTISGVLGFAWKDQVGGTIQVNPSSTLEKVSGSATVGLLDDIDLGGGVRLVKGGNATIEFDGASVTSLAGTLALSYDEWLRGTIQVSAGSTLSSISGSAELAVEAPKTFGKIEIRAGSNLGVDFAGNSVTQYRGNVEVGYEDWLKGTLNFKAQDLASVSGTAALTVTQNHDLAGPVSILEGSNLRANFENSDFKDFGGTVGVGVKDWGQGTLTVQDGSTTKSVSGDGQLELSQPKPLGAYVTMTQASLGTTIAHNEIKSIYGEARGTVKEFGEGWLRIAKSSTLTEFDGQAGLKLTTPKPIGRFAELSGGELIANFERNALKDFGGSVDITVFGWGKGNVTIDPGSTLDYIKGSARLELTEPKSLAGGIVKVTGGSVGATVDGQQLKRVAGSLKIQIKEDVQGEIQGEIDVAAEKVSGTGKLNQIRPWQAGPVKITDGVLSATVTDNKMSGATGAATIDGGRYGRGRIEVSYEDIGAGPVFYGKGWVEFQPHERVKGKLNVNLSREQKLSGDGQVDVKISDKINGMAGVALDEQGHVKLRGSVTIPGPFELFKPPAFKRDMTLLDTSFLVYTPPMVKVNVGAGIGLECGIKPLTISNIVIGGEVDLMEPSFAAMSVTGHLSSSAYCDLNAYVEGSVSVSAAVVAVEAGLRATLNLHLEAALNADPTMTVNRNGLSFDMPVDAKLTAALNLILTFFAKVKVGVDVGLFSIMKTVWRYEKSPDPLNLAQMEIGAKGRVRAGAGGFSASMDPQYRPPDMSIDSLKRALKL
jgi:hypothetical protein